MKPDMSDWRSTQMKQRNPHNLDKIQKSIDDIKKILRPEDDLLDIGCYHGHLYKKLGHEKYTGMDLFDHNVERARNLNPGVKFLQGDVFSLEGKWDVIVCCRVLMHLPNFEDAVKRLRSCTRRRLAVVIPTSGTERCDTETNEQENEKTYFRTFSREEVIATGGKILPHDKYSTVFYDPLLP